MRHKKNTLKLNRTVSHRRALLSNLVMSLVQHEKIYTTVAKGKAVKSLADKLISSAKHGDLHSRRQVARTIKDKNILRKLFSDIAPRYQDSSGGYCRLIHVGSRAGDNAPIVLLELVVPEIEEAEPEKGKSAKKKKKGAAQPEKVGAGIEKEEVTEEEKKEVPEEEASSPEEEAAEAPEENEPVEEKPEEPPVEPEETPEENAPIEEPEEKEEEKQEPQESPEEPPSEKPEEEEEPPKE